MEKVIEDSTGRTLKPGDYAIVTSWNQLEPVKIRKFTQSCMICETIHGYRLQPYLPGHACKHTRKDKPNRMMNVFKITEEQYEYSKDNR